MHQHIMATFVWCIVMCHTPIFGLRQFHIKYSCRRAQLQGGNGRRYFSQIHHIVSTTSSNIATTDAHSSADVEPSTNQRRKLDGQFLQVALPAFLGLAAEPLVSIMDGMYVGQLGAASQAGMGIAISAQYSVAKLYNDPLLKTSTSLVAGKEGDELSASVATAIATAMIIGLMQSIVYLFFAGPVLNFMGVSPTSDMRKPALSYLQWRALGVPAATVLIVSNGVFRGRGDTKTPLICTTMGNIVNVLLDPFLIFHLRMGVAGAGAANAAAQWLTALPLLYLLNKSIPFKLFGREKGFFQKAFKSYVTAGGLIFLRTVAKIAAYTGTSAAAASLGTIPMAAYSLTFNLGFTAAQLCEAVAIASQALIARDMPLNTASKNTAAAHVITRSLQVGALVSALLASTTYLNLNKVLSKMTASPEVAAAAAAVMPVVLLAQIIKGVSSSTGGILLGGLDWVWSTAGMGVASVVCLGLIQLLPKSLHSIWVSLAVFMALQVGCALCRISSGTGPWAGLEMWWSSRNLLQRFMGRPSLGPAESLAADVVVEAVDCTDSPSNTKSDIISSGGSDSDSDSVSVSGSNNNNVSDSDKEIETERVEGDCNRGGIRDDIADDRDSIIGKSCVGGGSG